ncbi:MAG: glycosyltransferase family 4 protein [Chloroflexi bacterium]|nr:glycosyltransferase family 4 protein [Chloroflexota bacterium]
MKIFMACDHPLPPELYGGIQYYVLKLAEAMQRSGHELEVFSPVRDPSRYPFRVNAVRRYGILFAEGSLAALKTYPLGYFRMLHSLRGSLSNGSRCDILHAHNPFISGNAGRQVIKETGIPAVLTYYGWDTAENHLQHKGLTWTERLARLSLKGYRKIVVYNALTKVALQERFGLIPGEIEVLPLAVDTDFFRPGVSGEWVREKYDIPRDRPLVLFLGSVGKQKGVHVLIAAVKEALQKTDLYLMVAGNGPFLETAKEMSRTMGLDNRVTFTGGVPEEDLPAFLNACDIFVNPSLDDCYSLVVLEASACGKAVIGTDHPIMVEEYAGHGNSGHILLCPRGDHRKLSGAILHLVDNPDLRQNMGRKAREKVESRHTLTKYCDSLLQIYEKAIGN